MDGQAGKIRIAIIDDHQMVRQGLRAFLQLAKDIEVVAEGASGEEALSIAAEHTLDVVLMDLVMPGKLDGVAATRELRKRHPNLHIVALTSYQEADRMMGVIEAGALSYLQKDVSPEDLLGAVRQAAAGRTVLEPMALSAILKGPGRTAPDAEADPRWTGGARVLVEPLTLREQDVLRALAEGLSNKEIAGELGIAEKTVKVHVSHILSKLGVYDRTQAIIAATKSGLIKLD
jgi:NarL family two-component system response regulator LiaR